MSEVGALTPTEAESVQEVEDEQRSAALQAVYTELPGDVVQVCEHARLAIHRVTTENLRRVQEALAPYGKFKAWCEAAGIHYSTAYSRLDRADHDRSKQTIAQRATASLPEQSTLPPARIVDAAPDVADDVGDFGRQWDEVFGADTGEPDEGEQPEPLPVVPASSHISVLAPDRPHQQPQDDATDEDNQDDVVDEAALNKAISLGDNVTMVLLSLGGMRRSLRENAHDKRLRQGADCEPVTREMLDAWWSLVSTAEWQLAREVVPWLRTTTNDLCTYILDRLDETPPCAAPAAGSKQP